MSQRIVCTADARSVCDSSFLLTEDEVLMR